MESFNLLSRIRQVTERDPGKIAIENGERFISYALLEKDTTRLAGFFAGKDLREKNIPVLLDTGIPLVEALLGILKSGNIFLPVSPNSPEKRIALLLKKIETDWVISVNDHLDKLNEVMSGINRKVNVLVLDSIENSISNYAHLNLHCVNDHSSVDFPSSEEIRSKHCYIYFTSGSTGEPKGVLGRERSLRHFIEWEIKEFGVDQSYRVSQFTPPTFDPFLRDIFVPLCSGGTICIPADSGILLEPAQLVNWIDHQRISLIHMVPSLFRVLTKGLTNSDCLADLRYILLAGEMLRGCDLPYFYELFKNRIQLINLYGPTETTLAKLFYRIQASDINKINIPVGRPIMGAEAWVLDSGLKKREIGQIGEIYIRTPFISSGYLNDPELTRRVFLPNPYTNNPQDLIYKTGDLGRVLPDGNFECLGRVDHQVKIRGMRIEPAEIEHKLLKMEWVKEAVVIDAEDREGVKYLCAYLVAECQLTVSMLRRYLAGELPEQMIPAHFVQIEKFPLTPHGKLDRSVLPKPETNIATGIEHSPPATFTERKLATIWQEILGTEKIGTNDNFFELGGHSLRAAVLISRIYKEFNTEVSLRQVFQTPTMKALAEYIEGATSFIYSSIEPAVEKEYYPLSSAQRRMYILNQLEGIGTSYNMPGNLLIEGRLDRKRLEESFQKLVERHEGFRTSFLMVNGEPVQRVHQKVDFQVDYWESEEKHEENLAAEFMKPFNLEEAPLFRIKLIKTGVDRHILLFDMHHIIADGTSRAILVREFIDLYGGKDLPPLKIQYKDYAVWQNETARREAIQTQEKYWLSQFSSEIPVLNLPVDFPRPLVQSFEGDRIPFNFNREITGNLMKLASGTGVTLNMILLAAYNILLYKYTGQEDLVVGVPVAGRPHQDLQHIIGMFVNTLALRNQPRGDKSYREFLNEIKDQTLTAFENQDYQFEELVEKLNIRRDLGRNPLFDVMLVLQNMGSREIKIKDLIFTPVEFPNRTAKFDLSLNVVERDGEIFGELEYCSRLFKEATVERIAEHFRNILKQITDDLDIDIGKVNILTPEERKLILDEFNATNAHCFGYRTIQEIFEEQAGRIPEKVAVIFGEKHLTYEELNGKANQLANYLIDEHALQPDTLVGVLMERSELLPVAIFGILKAGGAYLPIDPNYPAERIKLIINDARLGVIISSRKQLNILDKLQWECRTFHTYLCLDCSDLDTLEEKDAGRVIHEEKLWEYIGDSGENQITGGGWVNNYNGEHFSPAEMEEYADNVFEKIKPFFNDRTKVLEIGCASGISMYRIAPHVDLYYGTDLSRVMVEKNRIRIAEQGFHNIQLACIPAHEIDQMDEQEFDIVIINSVVQYFPSHRYLRRVLRKAIDLLGQNGVLFIGDIRDLDLKPDLIRSLLEYKENHPFSKYTIRTDFSDELFLSRDYFQDLASEFPEITQVRFFKKIHTVENELTKYRFDALLEISKNIPEKQVNGKKVKRQEGNHLLLEYSRALSIPEPHPGNLAYVIYTSGSSGRPKGVMINHAGVVNILLDLQKKYPLLENEAYLLKTTYTFDVSVAELFGWFLGNGRLVILEEGDEKDPQKILQVIDKYRITHLNFVPSMFSVFLNTLSEEDLSIVNKLKYIFVAGEAISGELVRKFQGLTGAVKLENLYGPTEATIYATGYPLEYFSGDANVPIGKPLANIKTYIINRDFQLQPLGVPGELCITGVGLARGYLNKPDLTAEKFVPNPFNSLEFRLNSLELNDNNSQLSTLNSQLMYRTGDLTRWLPNGEIEFLGRIDNQVKVRGYRIELGEIESQLLRNQAIKEAVVIDREDSSGDKYLCAYLISGEELTTQKLREDLVRELPEYMIPSYFIQLEKLPLTPNGKLNRKELPEPYRKTVSGQDYIAPANETEIKLAGLWRELLGVKEIGRDDNFFELGGHSLKATVLASRIHKSFQVEVPLKEIFKSPTIKGLAVSIENAKRRTYLSIQPTPESEYYPVSAAQRRMFLLNQFEGVGIAYNMPGIMLIEGNLDRRRLEESFKDLVRRHDSFRTSFVNFDGEPVQKIHREVDFEVSYRESPPDERIEEFFQPFDLTRAPLLRVELVKQKVDRHLLLFDMHHLISDGASAGIVIRELIDFYQGRKLPELKIQYKDFSVWQNQLLKNDDLRKQEKYWLDQFMNEIPVVNLPADSSRPSLQSFEGERVKFSLDEKTTAALKKLAITEQVTLYMILLAAFNIFLFRYTGQEDLIVGTPVAGRSHSDLENIIGLFVNTLALRNKPEGGKNFREFLGEVKETAIGAYDNQDYQFEELVEKLNLIRDLSRNPLFDVMFTMQNAENPPLKIMGLEFIPYEFERRIAKFDLSLQAIEAESTVQFNLEYCAKLFRKDTVARMAKHLMKIIQEIVENPELKLAEIEMLTEEEKAQILYGFNGTESAYSKEKTIPEIFEKQAAETPEQIAITFEGKEITYRVLNEKVNRLARILRNKGVVPDQVVGLLTERSLEMIIGMLGILKAGGVYLPLDPEHPGARLRYFLDDSQACLLVTYLKKSAFPKFLPPDLTVVDLVKETLSEGDGSNPERVNKPHDLAYLIYTSGSTGMPKGVMIEHRSVINLVAGLDKTIYQRYPYPLRVALIAPYTFDASVQQIFAVLLFGRQLFIVPEEARIDGDKLVEYFRRNMIDISDGTPTHIRILSNLTGSIEGSHPKHLIIGGEALPLKVVSGFLRKIIGPKPYITNVYGPTECTVDATAFLIEPERVEYLKTVPIGTPLANVQVYVLGKNLEVVPVGVNGEVYISGAGVGRSYWNNPELTAEKFIPNPFISEFQMMYKTGDLARWLPDGNLEFLGRVDLQVKVRSFRIEPEEIENRLLNYTPVTAAVVCDRMDSDGNTYLCAYVTAERELTVSELRNHLSRLLPNYMIPAHFVQLEKLPLTSNGKVNRKALPEPDDLLQIGVEYAAPQNEIERKLAEIWEQVLGKKNIGIYEDFFMLGGDSIKALQVIARMQKHGLRLDLGDLFQSPKIKDLGGLVKTIFQKIDQGVVEGVMPLTPAQCWFFEQKFCEPHHWNQSMMFYRAAGFDENAVRKVFQKITEHHDALRMVYQTEPVPVQINRGLDGELYSLEVFNLHEENDLQKRVTIEATLLQKGIDLKTGPLVKLGLFKTGTGDHLLVVIHHLVIDGVSWRILLEDFQTGYHQAIKEEPIRFPEKTGSFKRWAETLVSYAQSPGLMREKDYWEKLGKSETSPLPRDYEAHTNRESDTDRCRVSLTEAETIFLLGKANHAYYTEINDLLLTALGLAVKDWTGVERVLINLEGHGREEILEGIDISRTVGWFTSIYPVGLDLSVLGGLGVIIKTVKENNRRIPHRGIGYGVIKYLAPENFHIDELRPEISFNYFGQFDQDLQTDLFTISSLSPGAMHSPDSERCFTLEINAFVINGQLTFELKYNRFEFQPVTVLRFLEGLKGRLQEIIEHCRFRDISEYSPSDYGDSQLSIEELGYLIEQAQTERLEIERIYPLTPMQEGMLLHGLLHQSSTAYFEQYTFFISGKLDPVLFEKSFQILTQQYDLFRTIFFHENLERPRQVVVKERPATVNFTDITSDNQNEMSMLVTNYQLKDRARGFDLRRDPLSRVSIYRTGECSYRVIWSFHHMIMDGWSIGLVFKEILNIYRTLKQGQPWVPVRIPQYVEYVNWLEKQDRQAAGVYWEKYLEGYEQQATLPGTRRLEQAERFNPAEISFALDETCAGELTGLAGDYQVTLNTIFQAIWGILLHRYNNTDDVVFGTVVAGRSPEIKEIEKMAGLFINTIPVRIRRQPGLTFADLLGIVQQSALAGRRYEYYSLAEIQTVTPLKQGLIDHLLVFENYPIEPELNQNIAALALEFVFDGLEIFEQTNYDFNLIIVPGKEIKVKFNYNRLVFEDSYLKRLQGHLLRIISLITKEPEILLDEISILTKEEKTQILTEFNNTRVESTKYRTVLEFFTEQAVKNPERVAVVGENLKLTYREIDFRANQVSKALRNQGVGPEQIVGIMVERSPEMIIGILGIFKAGGAYLPVDPGYPAARLNYLLEDSGARILLTRGRPLTKVPPTVTIIDLADQGLLPEDAPSRRPIVEPRTLAYLLYTSGSTGKPKGVMVEQGNIVNILAELQQKYPLLEQDAFLLKTTFTFDVSAPELFGWFFGTGRLVILKEGLEKDPRGILAAIDRYGVTHLNFVPSMFREFLYTMAQEDVKILNGLKYIFVAGEALTGDLIRQFHDLNLNGKIQLENLYGPTESTVYATGYSLEHLNLNEDIPIGKPLPNIKAFIMNGFGQLQPIGVTGELCLGGIGVARGYLNRPDLTAEKFVPNPFEGEGAGSCFHSSGKTFQTSNFKHQTSRLYRTGDLARWLPDGNIEFLGRMDNQVKIRGFRIELGEIEHRLQSFPTVKKATVITREDQTGNKELIAYLVAEESLTVSKLRDALSISLPPYMVPAHFIQLDDFPLTASGKLDRHALPDPERRSNIGLTWMAPRNEIESFLVGVWSSLLMLPREKIGVADNFFDLGGNSLLLIRMHAQIEKNYPGRLTMTDLFALGTIQQLAVFIEKKELKTEIILRPMPLPAEYFLEEDAGNENTVFEFPIPPALVEKIGLGETKQVFSISEILLGCYFYLFYEVTGNEGIVIQTIIDDHHRVMEIEIDFSGVEDFLHLLHLLRKERLNPEAKVYHLGAIVGLKDPKKQMSILPFFSNQNRLVPDINFLNTYDLIYKMDLMDGKIKFICEYDYHRLKEEKVEALIRIYLKLLENVTNDLASLTVNEMADC